MATRFVRLDRVQEGLDRRDVYKDSIDETSSNNRSDYDGRKSTRSWVHAKRKMITLVTYDGEQDGRATTVNLWRFGVAAMP